MLMADLVTENDCVLLQCLCWGNNPRLFQLAVGFGFVAVGGGERPNDPAVAPTSHLFQPPAWGGST